jgi:hypothetical protein
LALVQIWGQTTDIIQALRLSAANSLNQTRQQVVRMNLNIQPTLTIGPGFPVNVIVDRDLVLEPYPGVTDVCKLKIGAIEDDKPVTMTIKLHGCRSS